MDGKLWEKYLKPIYDEVVKGAPDVLMAIIALIVGFWVIGRIVSLIKKILAKNNVDEDLRPFLASIVSVGLKVALIIAVAGMFGVETTSFVAILGALAFAVGMALQGTLGHFASGVLILLFKPYRTGDLVDIQGHVGVVSEIQIFNTVLLTPDNKKIILPNGTVTSGPITNISGQGEIGVFLTFGVEYGADIDKTRAVIQEVVGRCPYVLKDKDTLIKVSALADSAVNFDVRPWCKSEHYWDTYFFMHEEVKKALDKASIGIPYPHMDVTLVK